LSGQIWLGRANDPFPQAIEISNTKRELTRCLTPFFKSYQKTGVLYCIDDVILQQSKP
jgi:hypothetical protein